MLRERENSNICTAANTEQKITLEKSPTNTINGKFHSVLALRQLIFGMICIKISYHSGNSGKLFTRSNSKVEISFRLRSALRTQRCLDYSLWERITDILSAWTKCALVTTDYRFTNHGLERFQWFYGV
jgi:hypothetical protein